MGSTVLPQHSWLLLADDLTIRVCCRHSNGHPPPGGVWRDEPDCVLFGALLLSQWNTKPSNPWWRHPTGAGTECPKKKMDRKLIICHRDGEGDGMIFVLFCCLCVPVDGKRWKASVNKVQLPHSRHDSRIARGNGVSLAGHAAELLYFCTHPRHALLPFGQCLPFFTVRDLRVVCSSSCPVRRPWMQWWWQSVYKFINPLTRPRDRFVLWCHVKPRETHLFTRSVSCTSRTARTSLTSRCKAGSSKG